MHAHDVSLNLNRLASLDAAKDANRMVNAGHHRCRVVRGTPLAQARVLEAPCVHSRRAAQAILPRNIALHARPHPSNAFRVAYYSVPMLDATVTAAAGVTSVDGAGEA